MRTALFQWLAARSTGGSFILRIEDTDQGRYVAGSEEQILASLRWLGLEWDEGPEVGGPFEPYVQSLRGAHYSEVTSTLIDSGAAYWCDCTPQRLEAMRTEQRQRQQPTRYDRHCLTRQDEVGSRRDAGVRTVLRQRMPEGHTTWDDLIRGEVTFDNKDIDDQVLLKGDGFPTYHLAATSDDHLMGISHVLRAEEWLPSTPKHLALFAAMGWRPPSYGHLPVVLGEDRQKLSKRRGARNVLEYRELGYLPSAVVNAMVLLGWSSGSEDEVFAPSELAARFSIDRVNQAPAVFDPRRLDALNGLHLRRLSAEELATALDPWLPEATPGQRLALVPLVQERMVRLDEAPRLCAPLLGEVTISEDVAFPPPKVDRDCAVALLAEAAAAVERGALDDPGALREHLTAILDARGVKPRDGFRVLYVAILGTPAGVPVFEAMRFIGAERSVARLRAAQARLRQPGQ